MGFKVSSTPSTAKLWFYLYFPLLPLEMLYSDKTLKPAVLLDQRRARLWLCNEQASEQGLKSGMAVATACSLCPKVQLLSRQPQQERQQLESLALWAGSFSAQISLQNDNGILLESASMLPYFQGFEPYHRRLQQQLQNIGFSSTIATGHTPLAARLLAHNGGFISTEPEQHLAQLGQLPVAALKLEPKTQERLIGMGLCRLYQLLQLPRNELASRLGAELLDYIDRLRGQQPDPQPLFTPPLQFIQRLDLLHEIDNSQALLFPLRRLLAALEGYLNSRQLRAETLLLELSERQKPDRDACATVRLPLKHSGGEYRSEAWLELWRLRLERLQLQQPIIAMQLSVDQFLERQGVSQDLFVPEKNTQSQRQSPQQLLSRLQTRLGEGAISRIGLVADHRPEKSWRRIPSDQPAASINTAATVTAVPATTAPKGYGAQRPCWLLKQPQPLPAVQLQQQIIRLLQGPERIVSGWWDKSPIRRDYYIGRWPDGRLGWLYRNHQGEWYLHGWFG
ncbi:MAG: DNA polymerase Y family protein [Motiliproteus sp.]